MSDKDFMTEWEWDHLFGLITSEDLRTLENLIALRGADTVLHSYHVAGLTALNYAVKFGSLHAVEFLLQKGADPNLICRGVPYSALYDAVDGGKYDVARRLLEFGADPDLCLPGLSSARDLAEERKELRPFLALFEALGTSSSPPAPNAALRSPPPCSSD